MLENSRKSQEILKQYQNNFVPKEFQFFEKKSGLNNMTFCSRIVVNNTFKMEPYLF